MKRHQYHNQCQRCHSSDFKFFDFCFIVFSPPPFILDHYCLEYDLLKYSVENNNGQSVNLFFYVRSYFEYVWPLINWRREEKYHFIRLSVLFILFFFFYFLWHYCNIFLFSFYFFRPPHIHPLFSNFINLNGFFGFVAKTKDGWTTERREYFFATKWRYAENSSSIQNMRTGKHERK